MSCDGARSGAGGLPAGSLWTCRGVGLEEHLQRQLHLPRRAGVASREARARDYAERRAADRGKASGQSEVVLVEDVERFDAELDARAADERQILDHRQVGVAESWSEDRVSSEVAEVTDASTVHRQ